MPDINIWQALVPAAIIGSALVALYIDVSRKRRIAEESRKEDHEELIRLRSEFDAHESTTNARLQKIEGKMDKIYDLLLAVLAQKDIPK